MAPVWLWTVAPSPVTDFNGKVGTPEHSISPSQILSAATAVAYFPGTNVLEGKVLISAHSSRVPVHGGDVEAAAV